MNVLITGINGFAASYLARFLLKEGHHVHGIARRNSDDSRLKKLGIRDHKRLYFYHGDVTDRVNVDDLIRKIKPKVIYNLAAIMYVQDSWDIPKVTFDTNMFGIMNILGVVKNFNKDIKVIQAGTSEEYGFVRPQECPITEKQPLRPMSPYGVSKVAAENMCRIYADTYDMDIIVTRAFNHAGPYQNPKLVIPKFIREVFDYAFNNKIIEHGNMSAVRDFIHVEDVVRGYFSILESGKKYRVLNICSGEGVSMKEIMEIIIETVKREYSEFIKYSDFENNMKQTYFRPNDVPLLEGSHKYISQITGWMPKFSIRKIILDMCKWIFEEEFMAQAMKEKIRVFGPVDNDVPTRVIRKSFDGGKA